MTERYAADHFDTFFEPLVGNEQNVAAFHEQLKPWVNGGNHPYIQLKLGAYEAIKHSVDMHAAADARRHEDWRVTQLNGFIAARLTVATIEAVDDVYTTKVKAPQYQHNVQKSVLTALRHSYSIAHVGQDSAIRNLAALRYGSNPDHTLLSFLRASGAIARDRKAIVHKPKVSRRAFAVTSDEEGQLHLAMRHKRSANISGGYCPAVDARIKVHDKIQPALLVFMQTIGNVAISEIYPRHFSIVDSSSSS